MAERLLIVNGSLVRPTGVERAAVLVEDGRIAAFGPEAVVDDARVIDATGLVVGPGFIDVHVHGGGGFSFFNSDPEMVRSYARWAPRNGVTGFLVSTVGRDGPETTRLFGALRPAIAGREGADALGFHMEGPFINPERKGAFPPGMLRQPEVAEFERHQEAAGGSIRQVTLAPELRGALDLVRAVAASGAIPAMGHTDATVEEAARGFDAGIRHVTHLYNAMRPLHQREGGPSVAALMDERVTCELICDGAHVVPDVLRMAYRILGPARTVVVTDNLHIAGTGSQGGQFGGQAVTVSGAKAVRGDGTIVGSVVTMDQHFRNARAFLGLDYAAAFQVCSTNPAGVAGAAGRKGALATGADADLVLLDGDDRVVMTVCGGEIAYDGRSVAG